MLLPSHCTPLGACQARHSCSSPHLLLPCLHGAHAARRSVIPNGWQGPGFGESAKAVTGSAAWQVPTQLVASSLDTAAASSSSPQTVYTVRFTTSFERGAALLEPLCGVNLCLIGKDGRGYLHRVAPVNDPQENVQRMETICQVVDDTIGADCSLVNSGVPPAWPGGKVPPTKPRFQEGSVDEVCFLGPELGPLAAMLVSPEGGTWSLDEVTVASSRTNHTDRFVCRRKLGDRRGERGAAYLTPVPPGAVVYGTGDAARVISKEQAAALHALSLADYSHLKVRLLLTTALLTLGGSGIAAVWQGLDAAIPFAVGGTAGLVYQLLLQLGADAAVPAAVVSGGPAGAASPSGASSNLSSKETAAAGGAGASGAAIGGAFGSLEQRVGAVLGNAAVRLALVTMFAVTAAYGLQTAPEGGRELLDWQLPHLTATEAWQLGLGALGFLMYKVALLSVTLAPLEPSSKEPARQLGKN